MKSNPNEFETVYNVFAHITNTKFQPHHLVRSYGTFVDYGCAEDQLFESLSLLQETGHDVYELPDEESIEDIYLWNSQVLDSNDRPIEVGVISITETNLHTERSETTDEN